MVLRLRLTPMQLKRYNVDTIDPFFELSPYGVRAWDNQDRKRVFLFKIPNILNIFLNYS